MIGLAIAGLVLLALSGWATAAWLWTHPTIEIRRQIIPLHLPTGVRPTRTNYVPQRLSIDGPCIELRDATGKTESVRALKGTAPKDVTRPHGREKAATVYKFLHQQGDRWIYQAES